MRPDAMMARGLVYALFLVAQCGCGGGWASSDTKSATDIVHESMAQLSLCADDAGTCNASQIRATARADVCAASSMLFRHDQALPDAGVQCAPP
jgi:hypothetical protein